MTAPLLALLVPGVAGFAELVGGLGLPVDELELAEHEDDRTRAPRAWAGASSMSLRRQPHRQVDDEMNDPVVLGAEAVVARR